MNSDLLIKQIETYSNAIVAFNVLQGLAYSYSFGTNDFFNCMVKTASHLAEGLALLFMLVMLLSIFATVSLARLVKQLSNEFNNVVDKIYFGKVIVVTIFSLVPIVLTVGYGVLDYPKKMECKVTSGLAK